MSAKRDFYEVLSVTREAGDDEIRRAYRKLALKYHPDRNPDDPEAEGKFKEATEAFSVLNDREKRGLYDRFGHAGLEGRGGFDFQGAGLGDILSQFQDMFSDFFGFGGGFGGQQRRGAARGRDVRVDATITLKDALLGCKQEIAVDGVAPCEECDGTGAKRGTAPAACPQCGGNGQVTTQRGFIMFSTTCPRCRGAGQVVKDPCAGCSGSGAVEKHRKVVVSFPRGIDVGQRLRVPGQGMPGPAGAEPGDLYVDVHVQPDERFSREGDELITRHAISFADAALGCEVSVTMPDDSTVEATVESGTQPNSVLTLPGQGMPRIDGRGRGGLHVVIEVVVPKKLTKRGKKLLIELEEELSQTAEKRVGTR
jgi:molecular chaperone DnaJ